MRFIHRDSVESTQDEARQLYEQGERGPVWVRAEEQRHGRGRLDRKWVSQRGNLFATLLLQESSDPSTAALTGFAVSLAIAETLDDYLPEQSVSLKWPNDVLVGGAKISGLLIEKEPQALLIGIGVNLVSHPDDTPYPATHLLAEMDSDMLRAAEPPFAGAAPFLSHLSSNLIMRVNGLRAQGFQSIREDWLARAHRLGEHVTVSGQSGTFSGMALDGALCLTRSDGTEARVHTGDVSFG